MTPSPDISDAEPEAWKRPRKPDPTPAELRLGQAARRYAHAADQVEAHEGPRSGPEYEAKLTLLDLRWEELLDAWWGFPAGDGRSFEAS